MDWPIDMPFPIFYQRWSMAQAKRSGWSMAVEKAGIKRGLTWETMKVLREAAYQKDKEPRIADQHFLLEEAMYNCECRTFLMSTNLVEALKKTDVRKIPEEMVKIPFDLIYIDVSSNPIKTNNDVNIYTEDARGILVLGQKNSFVRLFCTKYRHDPDHTLIGLPVEYAPGDTDGPEGPICNWTAGAMLWKAENGFYEEEEEKNNNAKEKEPELWNMWINSILYINSVNADVREEYLEQRLIPRLKKKSGKAKRNLKQHIESRGKVFRVGHYISIPQISGGGERKPPQGGKVSVRFMVRGHWHTYWIGSNRFGTKKQNLKWLMPYWKGPETADIVHGVYSVKAKSAAGAREGARDQANN